jgi:hypothetical protein
MKGIALTQPWASLWVGGEKINETRSWGTPYTGDLAVLASKNFPRWARKLCLEEPFRSALKRLGFNWLGDLPTGKLVGIVRMDDCVLIKSSNAGTPFLDTDWTDRLPGEPELSFGDFTPGRYAWPASNPRRLVEPVPFKGRLGLFNVPDELLKAAA